MQRICSLALFLLLPLISPSQEISPEMRTEVNRRIGIQRDWGSQTNNSPGVQLVAKEAGRAGEVPGPIVVKYELFTRGLPHELAYQLVSFPITAKNLENLQDMGEVYIDKNEQLVDSPNDPRVIFFFDPAPGEPFRLALIAENREYKAYLSIVPNPIEANDRGCRLSVIRLMPKFELAFIQGTGFAAESKIEFEVDSLGEIHSGHLKANKDGYVDASILPFVRDKPKGTTKISMISSRCKPEVRFHWGATSE